MLRLVLADAIAQVGEEYASFASTIGFSSNHRPTEWRGQPLVCGARPSMGRIRGRYASDQPAAAKGAAAGTRRARVILRMYRADVAEKTIARFPEFVREMPKRYHPILAPVVALQARLLGVEPQVAQAQWRPADMLLYEATQSVVRAAEIFRDKTTLFVVAIRQRTGRPRVRSRGDIIIEVSEKPSFELWLYCLLPVAGGNSIDRALSLVQSAFGADLTPYFYTSNSFDELKKGGMTPPPAPSADDLSAAELLSDRAVRTIAIAVKASAGLLVRDLAKPLVPDDKSRVGYIHAALLQAGLVDVETVVICKRTQSQTARVPSLEVLHELAAKGLKCACGKAIAEEQIEEALTITERGRRLTDGSRWLSLLLQRELLALGVPPDEMLIEKQAGGDEMDCLANMSGELVLFELKDKEFNLGAAYSFGAKLGIIHPEHPVIVTTEHVGGDAREHFQRAGIAGRGGRNARRYVYEEPDSPSPIRYIEGVGALQSGLRELASAIYGSDASRILGEVLPLGSLAAKSLVDLVSGSPAPDRSARRDPRRRSRNRSERPASSQESSAGAGMNS